MDAQMCKMVTNRQTNHEQKEVPKTCTWKWQNKVKHKPSKAWFSNTIPHRIAVSTFPDLLRVCSKRHPKPFGIEACGCLWRHKLVEERFKNHTINKHQKSMTMLQKCTQKTYPEKLYFCGFSGSGSKGVPGWSQRPPEPPTRSNLVEFFTNKGARNCISVRFY